MSRHGLLLSLFATIVCVQVCATPIAIDGTYHEFVFGEAPGPAIECLNQSCSPTTNPIAESTSTSPWTFSGPASLFVLDIGHIGDVFEIFDNGVSLGTTSTPVGSSDPCGFDIACAAGVAGYSRANISLANGDHSLSFAIVQNAPEAPTPSGQAVFSVSASSAVPETSTWLLVGSALVLVGTRRWGAIR